MVLCEITFRGQRRRITETIEAPGHQDGESTPVAVEVDYSVSAPFGGGVTEALMFRPHEQELEAMLANLKARLERNGNRRAAPVG